MREERTYGIIYCRMTIAGSGRGLERAFQLDKGKGAQSALSVTCDAERQCTFSSLSLAFLAIVLGWIARLAILLAYGRLQRPPERVGSATIELRGTPLVPCSGLTREDGLETLIARGCCGFCFCLE